MDLVIVLKSGDPAVISTSLQEFLTGNCNTFSFPQLDGPGVRKELWDRLIGAADDASLQQHHLQLVSALKILSRDKRNSGEMLDEGAVQTLLALADLNPRRPATVGQEDREIGERIVETQKCIFNLIFNNVECRRRLLDAAVAEAVLHRLSQPSAPAPAPEATLSDEIRSFDLKILFLLSALCPDSRPRLRYTLRGVHRMMDLLEAADVDQGEAEMSSVVAARCAEALKIAFNLLLSGARPQLDAPAEFHVELFRRAGEDDDQCETRRLMAVVGRYLRKNKPDDLKSHAINLLTAIDSEHYEALHSTDMSVVDVLLQFLEDRLELPNAVLREKLAPVLTVLIEYSRRYGPVRRRARALVLPPLRGRDDVVRRPEQGDALRNKLCRLMTCCVNQVETLVAELLFVLCKENVRRLIKYTGYGNAAGLLANRGLMADSRPPTHYSDDSDDSDTEEYAQVEDRINPVTGCYEPPRPDPMAGMSDEQKEYEAVRLLNLIDRLQRDGVIRPARVGADGRPQPLEHVLQMADRPPQGPAGQ